MISKIIVSCAVFLVTGATYLHDSVLENTGTSTRSSERDAFGNYAFSYEIVDKNGASNTRSEVGDSQGNKKGSYSLHDVDGRTRLVNYIADEHGFRVAVSTNEPGTAKSEPAHAIIDSPYSVPEAPTAISPVTVVHEEPVVVAPIAGATKISRIAVGRAVLAAFPTKSVTSHGTKVVNGAPAPIHTKSYVPPLAPAVISASSPVASTKSVVSGTAPFGFASSIPLTHSAKSVVYHARPISGHFTIVPQAISTYSKHPGGRGHSFFQHHVGGIPFHSGINHDVDPILAYSDHGLHYNSFFNGGPFRYNI